MFEQLTSLLLPKAQCLACSHPRNVDTGGIICGECTFSLAQEMLASGVCLHCLSPRRGSVPCGYCASGGMENLTAAYAPYHYHGVVQQLVVRIKFGAADDAAIPLANAMSACVRGIPFDYLVPVPLHKNRLAERGINQAALLCDLISPKIQIPILHALKRIKDTKRQSSLLSIRKRHDNVENAFEAVVNVQGLRLLLVDDVRTTGSTARACAKKLRQAGAAEVSLLTAAIAPPRLKKEGRHG
mgnify:CR=1 FL=1